MRGIEFADVALDFARFAPNLDDGPYSGQQSFTTEITGNPGARTAESAWSESASQTTYRMKNANKCRNFAHLDVETFQPSE